MHIQQGEFVLVVGGARSGKSVWAEQLTASLPGPVVYLATSQVKDAEMAQRVLLHKQRRPSDWRTLEEPLQVAEAIEGLESGNVVLLDCLTLWLTNLLFQDWPADLELQDNTPQLSKYLAARQQEALQKVERLATVCKTAPVTVIAVSNEVGQGIVPGDPVSRWFRDTSGWMNQIMAGKADRVYTTIAGLAVDLKKIGVSVLSK